MDHNKTSAQFYFELKNNLGSSVWHESHYVSKEDDIDVELFTFYTILNCQTNDKWGTAAFS